jgi:hypothetical protein
MSHHTIFIATTKLEKQNDDNSTATRTLIQLEKQDDDDVSTTTMNCLDLLQQKELRPMNC